MRYLLPLLFLFACDKAVENTDLPISVVTENVIFKKKSNPLVYSGTSKAPLAIRASFQISGTVQELPVTVGQHLKEGEVIARLDPRDYQLKVEQAESTLRKNQSEFKRARSEFKKISELYENNNATLEEYNSARVNFEAKVAAVNLSTKQLETAKEQLVSTVITSPHPYCVVSEKIGEISENINPAEPVVILSCGKRLEVEVAIPSEQISFLYVGMPIQVTFDKLQDERFTAHITELVKAAPGSTTFPMIAVLDELTPKIGPGMTVSVHVFPKKNERHILYLPGEAVGEDLKGQFVYLYVNGIAKRQSVVIGNFTRQGVEILQGLKDGDEVITGGIHFLSDGQRVQK